MVLAGLGDAWIRFLGARDSARLASRHSQQTPLPASTPGRVVAALLFRSLSWNLDAGVAYLPSTLNQQHTYEHGRQPKRSKGPGERCHWRCDAKPPPLIVRLSGKLMQCPVIGDWSRFSFALFSFLRRRIVDSMPYNQILSFILFW